MAPPRVVQKSLGGNGFACPAAKPTSLNNQANFSDRPASIPDQIRSVARDVRAIGNGRNRDPESILIDKHDAAERLFDLARKIEAAG